MLMSKTKSDTQIFKCNQNFYDIQKFITLNLICD